MKNYAFKQEITGEDIKQTRERLKLDRKQMATFLNISSRTLESWEISKKPINGPITSLLRIINEYPEFIEKYEIPNRTYPLRMLYMENGNINTVIDVDMVHRKVKFKNFTNDVIARAFGVKEEVTYEDFESFLEGRCYPKTRDKAKIQEDLLGIPFYDPLLIIEKTQGRMVDDDYYLVIESEKHSD